jgi:hypothetical protein
MGRSPTKRINRAVKLKHLLYVYPLMAFICCPGNTASAQTALEIPDEVLTAMQKTGQSVSVRFIQYEEKGVYARFAGVAPALGRANCEKIQNETYTVEGDETKVGQTTSYLFSNATGQASVTVGYIKESIEGKGNSCRWRVVKVMSWQHWDQGPQKRGALVTHYDLYARKFLERREINDAQYAAIFNTPGATDAINAVKPKFVAAGEREIAGLVCKVYRLQAAVQATALGTEICITSGDPNQGGDLGLLLYLRVQPEGMSSPIVERIAVRAYSSALMDAGVLGRPNGTFDSRLKNKAKTPAVSEQDSDDSDDSEASLYERPKARGAK